MATYFCIRRSRLEWRDKSAAPPPEVQIGETVAYDGPPGCGLWPIDDAARKAKAKIDANYAPGAQNGRALAVKKYIAALPTNTRIRFEQLGADAAAASAAAGERGGKGGWVHLVPLGAAAAQRN